MKLVVDENCMINLFCSSQNPRRMNENMNQRLELQNDPCTHDESKHEMCTNRLLVQFFYVYLVMPSISRYAQQTFCEFAK